MLTGRKSPGPNFQQISTADVATQKTVQKIRNAFKPLENVKADWTYIEARGLARVFAEIAKRKSARKREG